MTSLQLKHGFGKTASGNMNKKNQQGKFKQIELADDDIEMFSPQFLQSKTLKKPFKDYGLVFNNSNRNFIQAETDKTQKNPIPTDLHFQASKTLEGFNSHLNKTKKIDYTFIGLDCTSQIKPAYKPVQEIQHLKNIQPSPDLQFSLDNKNTIFSAIVKKGMKPKKTITFESNEKPTENKPIETQRVPGKAQNKLKQLFNKNGTKTFNTMKLQQKKPQEKKAAIVEDIDEQIQESINQYGEDFEQFSGESAIKQSIREELAVSSGSGFIKESIREQFGESSNGKFKKSQIVQEIQQSIKTSKSASKDQIPEFIASYKSSRGLIKEEIQASLSVSRKSGESGYEEIFEEYEESLQNSKSAFKKSQQKQKDSDVISKSFRKKASVVKSIRFAQQINNQRNLQQSIKKGENNNKYVQKLNEQKKQIMKKKADLSELFSRKSLPYEIPDKNKNLMYEFRIELNKLLTGQNFESKLRKLTSFINFGQQDSKSSVDSLENKILENILSHINKIKKPEITSQEITKLRSQYDHKLNTMLKEQQMNLKLEMDRKLHEKDMQLKKMIAELQKKFEGKSFNPANSRFNILPGQQNFQSNNSGLYEIESDYSIDSDNISWKADLWEVLPEYEKKKLYEKQTKEVTNFLTEIMINELKQQSLSRGDLDISFEFPEEFNDSFQKKEKTSNFPSINSARKSQPNEEAMPKAAFNRKQFDQNLSLNPSPKKQSIFPDFPRPKQTSLVDFDFNKKQNVNQYSKIEGEQPVERTKKIKLEKQKILQILSQYKSSYIRKKNDIIRKILKILKPKDTNKAPQEILSVIQQINILGKDDVNPNDLIYIRAYEQQLVWALANIMIRNENKKTQVIEEEMRKNYERLVVLCQARAAENAEQVVCLDVYKQDKKLSELMENVNKMQAKSCPLQIPLKEEAVEMLEKRQEKKIKNELVDNIINILMSEFAKDFPKRKK